MPFEREGSSLEELMKQLHDHPEVIREKKRQEDESSDENPQPQEEENQ